MGVTIKGQHGGDGNVFCLDYININIQVMKFYKISPLGKLD